MTSIRELADCFPGITFDPNVLADMEERTRPIAEEIAEAWGGGAAPSAERTLRAASVAGPLGHNALYLA